MNLNFKKYNKKKKIIFSQISKQGFKKNPLISLKQKNEVLQVSEGLYQFQGNFLKIFRNLNKYFYDLAIKKYKAIDQENPILWPIDLFKKIDYFSDFPKQVLMISGLKKNFKNLSSFSKKYKSNKKFKSIKIGSNFKNSNYGLQPAVCDTCYYSLSGNKNFKNKIFTTSNKVFRNENSNINNIDRLISFTVRDIMFVGDYRFVIRTKEKLTNSIIKFLKVAGIKCSIETANDPFFISNTKKKLFQDALDLKYEILADIPFLKKKIAIGSINFHYNTFGKAFNILKNNKYIFSGCIGIGFERLLLTLYSQFGTNLKLWPNKLKKIIKINKLK